MTYQVLAQQYRPHSLDQVIGQDMVTQAIKHTLSSGQLAPAYLLTGTRGVGKTTLGRIIATIINCESYPTDKACGTCESCKAYATMSHPDLYEIDAASKTKVEDTRTLLEHIQYAPLLGRYKIYLIDEVHMLSTHSFNALLKTLEEPPKHALFLLATTDPQKIPATILSRCIHYALSALKTDVIQSHMSDIMSQLSHSHDDDALAKIADSAKGSMRDALTMLEQARSLYPSHMGSHDVDGWLGQVKSDDLATLVNAILSQQVDLLTSSIEQLKQQNITPQNLLEQCAKYWHQQALKTALEGASVTTYINLFEITTHGYKQLSSVSYPWLVAEMTLIRCTTQQTNTTEEKCIPNTIHAHSHQSVAPAPVTHTDKNHATTPNTNTASCTSLLSKIAAYPATGMLQQALKHLSPPHTQDAPFEFTYKPEHTAFYTPQMINKIRSALSDICNCPEKNISVIQSAQHGTTAHQHQANEDSKKEARLRSELAKDPLINDLMSSLDASISDASIRSSDSGN